MAQRRAQTALLLTDLKRMLPMAKHQALREAVVVTLRRWFIVRAEQWHFRRQARKRADFAAADTRNLGPHTMQSLERTGYAQDRFLSAQWRVRHLVRRRLHVAAAAAAAEAFGCAWEWLIGTGPSAGTSDRPS